MLSQMLIYMTIKLCIHLPRLQCGLTIAHPAWKACVDGSVHGKSRLKPHLKITLFSLVLIGRKKTLSLLRVKKKGMQLLKYHLLPIPVGHGKWLAKGCRGNLQGHLHLEGEEAVPRCEEVHPVVLLPVVYTAPVGVIAFSWRSSPAVKIQWGTLFELNLLTGCSCRRMEHHDIEKCLQNLLSFESFSSTQEPCCTCENLQQVCPRHLFLSPFDRNQKNDHLKRN